MTPPVTHDRIPEHEPVGFRPVRKRRAPTPCICCSQKVIETATSYFDRCDPEISSITKMRRRESSASDQEVAVITSQAVLTHKGKISIYEDSHIVVRLVPQARKEPSKSLTADELLQDLVRLIDE